MSKKIHSTSNILSLQLTLLGLLFIQFFVATNLCAQASPLRFERYLPEQGLSYSTVTSIIQDESALYHQYQQAQKQKPPTLDTTRLATLHTEITQLQIQQHRKNQAKRLAIQKENLEKIQTPNRFTGILTVVKLE